MRKISVLCLSLMPLMLLALATPVFAARPTTETFTQVTVSVGVDEGRQFMTGDILHIKGSKAISFNYGVAWGNSIVGVLTINALRLNTTSVTGRGIGHKIDIYDTGIVKSIIKVEIVGAGPYVYMGPTFDFTVGEVTGTVTHGEVYIGSLVTGSAVQRGTSGALKGLMARGTYTGVRIMVGPLAGLEIVESTVTYRFAGHCNCRY
jgi:hypothetical protein